nr:hypothetical protein 6 [bacterium]
MAAPFLHQPSFAAGEVAPELYGRIDQALYDIGLRTCKNFLIRQYGGAWNRPGTKFTGPTQDFSKTTRLIPFAFNEEQTYCLEFGNGYMRVIKNGAHVTESAQNIVSVTLSTDITIEITGHSYSNGEDVYLSGLGGTTELNGRTFRVSDAATNTFKLKDFNGNYIDGSSYTTYTSGGTGARIYTLTTPWGESDLFDLTYTQSNDVLTVFHQDYYPRDITRTADNAWTIGNFANSEGPFREVNTTSTTLTVSAATGSGVTMTASASLFTSDMVGDLVYMEMEPSDTTARWEPGKTIGSTGLIRRAGPHFYSSASTGTTGTVKPEHIEGSETDGDSGIQWDYHHSGYGIAQITGYTSATVVTVTIIKRMPALVVSANTTTIWALAAWSETQGYPAAGCYHKQRFCLGGTTQQPNGLWLSGTGIRTFFGKANPVLDDDAITMLLDSTQVNAIRHLLPLSQLIVLTSASEQLVNGVDDVLSALDPPFAKVQGYTGASRVMPIIIGNTALFVQDLGGVVRTLQYSLDSDSFGGIDLSARSPHLFRGKTVRDWGYQRHPLSVIWTVMSDGALLGFTFMEEQQVFAWSRHEIGSAVESVCCIREGDETAAYFVVKRTIDGNTVRYIERLESRYFNTIRDAYFMDAGLTYDGRNYSEATDGTKTASTAVTMTLSGGSTWDSPETLTLTASASTFASTDVGDRIVIRYLDSSGNRRTLKLDIDAYTSATEVDVIPTASVPTDAIIDTSPANLAKSSPGTVNLRTTATLYWEFARDMFRPLDHLEGEEVAVLADGNVVNNISVSDGAVTLPTPAAVVHIGKAYTCDLETLDMARPQGQTKAKTVNIPRVFITYQESRGLNVGINGFDELVTAPARNVDMGYDFIPAQTNVEPVTCNSQWSRKGRIAIRQSDPLPLSINCISPEVVLGYS